jgi:hypothetical protein
LEVCGKEILRHGRLIRIGLLDGEGFEFLKDPEAAVEDLRKSGAGIDLFTFTQKLADTKPKYKYPMEWDNYAAILVSTYDEWMARQIRSEVRTRIRKAAKHGVVVREVPLDDKLLRGISAIYNETPVRRGKPFPHYGIDLESLRKMKSTFLEQSIFLGAYCEGVLIGFAKLVSDEDLSQAAPMHILSMVRQRDKCAMNALIAQAVRSCAERGISYLWYGKFAGDKHGASHLQFRRHNGFQQVDFPRYYVPLTSLGRMALRFGLHQGIIDRIPAPIAVAYRRVRALWYETRYKGLEMT